MQAKEQGRTLKRKNKSFICSPMSFDVVNGSNDLGLYHLTKKTVSCKQVRSCNCDTRA